MLVTALRRIAPASGALLVLLGILAPAAHARPRYAQREGVECIYCHERPGDERNFRGLYYEAHDLSFKDFDEMFEAKLAGVKPNSQGVDATPTIADYPSDPVAPALHFTLKDVDGKKINLGRFQGDVIMVVNVAPLCGNTPQYAALQKLYEKYQRQGFTILAFPANEFGKQDPAPDAEPKES